jgi:exodeoxyribonuclease V beta subunit
MGDLRRLARASGGSIAVEPLPEAPPSILAAGEEAPESLTARVFCGDLGVPWRIASFSAIARESEGASEAREDEWETPAPDAAPPGDAADIHRFPRGARAGRCLHDLLQRTDFTAPLPALEAVVANRLAAHAFDPGWTPAVHAMLGRVLECPLEGGADSLRLRDVARGDRLDELEFYYPISRATDAGIKRVLLSHGYGVGTRIRDEVDRLTFAPVEGFMRGFVDLVFRRGERFYLVDYKSNWLGDGAEAYRPDRLSAVMAREAYYLQSLIYLVAVHRYLGHRLPGYAYARHMGGIFYLFLRGMDPRQGPEAGVYRDRPEEALVIALDGYLARGEGA